MRRVSPLTLLAALSSFASAVFPDEVGVIDFHHVLLGVPQVETTFFHQPRKDDKASLLYTLSDLGVVGAVNPANGAVVWRHQVEQDITNGGGFLRAPEGEDWVAAASGSRVQAWSASTGRNVWDVEFKGTIKDLEIIPVSETPGKDVLVLSDEDGTTVLRRLDSLLGTVVWEFREVSRDVPLQISNDIASIFLVSLHGSPSSYSIRATTIDPATGHRLDQITIGTKGEVHSPDDVILVGANSAAPIVAWANLKASRLNIHVLGGKGKPHEVSLRKGTQEVIIHAPHSPNAQAHFLVQERGPSGDKGEVFHTNLKTRQVSSAYELPYLEGKGAFSVSTQDANVYFARIHDGEVSIISSESHGVLKVFPTKRNTELEPLHAVSEILKKPDGTFAVRSAVYNTRGNWVLVKNGEVDWIRAEGLSGAVAAVYSDIPERENLARVLEQEAQTNVVSAYIHRVLRHIDDLKHLPGWLVSLPANIVTGLVGGGAPKGEPLTRDSFGFNKIIVVVTRRGRVYGLDTGNQGKIAWSTEAYPQLGGEFLEVKGILSDENSGVVKIQGSKGELLAIRAVDGTIVESQPAGSSSVASTVIVDGQSFLAFGSDGKSIPELSQGLAPNYTIAVQAGEDKIHGVKFVAQGDKSAEQQVWQLQILPGRKIVDIAARASHDPLASIGRVLGDRRVLYKYINPNSIVVSVLDPETSTLSVQLVDAVSGQLLAAQSHVGVDGDKPISCTVSENWYACTFFAQYTLNDGSDRIVKGYQVVVSDLYESALPNDRGPLGDTSSFSTLSPVDSPTGSVPLPHVVSQAWVVSQPFSKLAVTQTRQGISNRNIVAYLPESHALVGVPRQFLDPRRPVDRDPDAAEMESEGLIKYSPLVEIDPRSIITHEWDVVGVQKIVASPAIVESTSLLVAFGVDIYGTQVAPSGVFDILGPGFNKATLIATVLALFVGVIFLVPLVRRSQIDRTWQAPL